uniref:Uncharacterized protein n=1 Tax=Aegilops tauschii subsp. strangulata TaxID=200361 RepID=A0A453DZN0_AEGTS
SGGGELGDGLGALRDGVLGELAGEDEADGGLDLAGRDGGLLVVARQLGGLAGQLLEDVVDEGVHDGHGLGGDADVRVHLFFPAGVFSTGFFSAALGAMDEDADASTGRAERCLCG